MESQAPSPKPPSGRAPSPAKGPPSVAPNIAAPPAALPAKSTPMAGRVTALTGLGACLVALLMPWMQISCGGARVEFEGYRLLTGTTGEKVRQFERQISQLTGSRPSQSRESGPEARLVVWIIFVGLGALGVAVAPSKAGALGGGLLCALIGGASLYSFYTTSNQQMQAAVAQGLGLVQLNWSPGFWLAWLATLLVPIGALIRLGERG